MDVLIVMLDSQSQDNWGWVQFNHNFLDRQSQTDIAVQQLNYSWGHFMRHKANFETNPVYFAYFA